MDDKCDADLSVVTLGCVWVGGYNLEGVGGVGVARKARRKAKEYRKNEGVGQRGGGGGVSNVQLMRDKRGDKWEEREREREREGERER